MSSKPISPSKKMSTTVPKTVTEVDSDDDDIDIGTAGDSENKIDLRIVTWNLEGLEEAPSQKVLNQITYCSESSNRLIRAFAFQEVKCLDKLRDRLWQAIGGETEYELFEHWMGRSGAGFAGLTVLFVFAPKSLCTSGRFRLSRTANSQVKREVLRGTRFKFGVGGTTSSRGAVSMPFSFLDTTFAIVSVRLLEEENEKSIDVQKADLEKVLELCRMSENAETSSMHELHHAFLCGSFALKSSDASSSPTKSSSTIEKKKSVSKRFSIGFISKSSSALLGISPSNSNGNLTNSSGESSFQFVQIKKKFSSLDDFAEIDSEKLAFDPDHVFYRCGSSRLEKCLEPVSSDVISLNYGRPCVSTLFRLKGRGQELLSMYERLTGNLPLHLSSRSNFVNAGRRHDSVAQTPRLSSTVALKNERKGRTKVSFTKINEDKFVLECTRCEGVISDSEQIVPVTADGNPYHMNCFCCDHCGVSLSAKSSTSLAPGQASNEVQFHEVDGKLYCQKSFEALFLKNCSGCGGSLGEEFLVIPDHTTNSEKRFHVSCFRCAMCSRPFATKILLGDIVIEAAIPHNGGYLCEVDFARSVGGVKCCICEHSYDKGIRINGEIFCFQDFKKMFDGGKCAECGKPVEDEQALTLHSKNPSDPRRACHMECLKCTICQKNLHELEGIDFVEFEGKTYCSMDWEKKKQKDTKPLCGKCRKPILGEHVEALEKFFHPNCFCCAFCRLPLNDVKFYLSDGEPWCLNDYERFCCPDLPACARCHRVIGSADSREAQKIADCSFHKNCFVCGDCGKNLTGRKGKLVKGKPFCEKC